MSKTNIRVHYEPLRITPEVVAFIAKEHRYLDLTESNLIRIGDTLSDDTELCNAFIEAIYRALDELELNDLGV